MHRLQINTHVRCDVFPVPLGSLELTTFTVKIYEIRKCLH